MYIYYDSTSGKIMHGIEAAKPMDNPPNNSGTALYLDNAQYSQLYNNGNFDLANWTIQNGVPVYTPVPASTLLENAKVAQKVLIQAGLDATLVGGFKSNATGHTYVTTTNGQSNMEGELKRFDLDSTLASVQFFTIDAGWIAHTHQDLINAFLDGGKWKDSQYSQQTTLNNQIGAATTVSAVQAITWTAATY